MSSGWEMGETEARRSRNKEIAAALDECAVALHSHACAVAQISETDVAYSRGMKVAALMVKQEARRVRFLSPLTLRERVTKRWLDAHERHDDRPAAEVVIEIVEAELLRVKAPEEE